MFFLPQRGFLTRLSVIAAAALYCTACGARLDGGIYAGGTGEFTLKTTLLPNMSRLLKSLSQDGGDAAVLNADALGKTFSAMPGIESASLVNTAPGSLEGRIKVSDIAAFLNRGPPASQNAASWEQSASGGRFRLTLTRDNGQSFLSLVSPELVEYLSALMAPVATGEALGEREYLEIVASVYGKALAAEIENAEFLLSVSFPGPVDEISGGISTGSRANFRIPLIKLLVLDEPLIYEVRWSSGKS